MQHDLLNRVFDLVNEQGDDQLFKQTVMLSEFLLGELTSNTYRKAISTDQVIETNFHDCLHLEHTLGECMLDAYLGHASTFDLPETKPIRFNHFINTHDLATHFENIHLYLTEWYILSSKVDDNHLTEQKVEILTSLFTYLTLTLGVLYEQ